MTNINLFEEGIESFLTGKFKTPLHAIACYSLPLTKLQRVEFANGFKHAEKILFD